MAWIQTYTGRQFWPLDPRAEEIDDRDIAHALSLLCRFTGHVERFYSVGEHSIRVAQLVDLWGGSAKLRLAALLHDASEAYLSDIARPIKRLPQMQAYLDAEAVLEAVIAKKYGFANITREDRQLIKKADSVLLVTEAKHLLKPLPEPWAIMETPLELDEEDILGADPPAVVESRFLALLDVYSEELATGE